MTNTTTDGLCDEFVECRALAHAWRYTTVDRDGRKFIQGLECGRCRTAKYVTLNHRGEVERTRYRYPNGYLMPGADLTSARGRGELRLRALWLRFSEL